MSMDLDDELLSLTSGPTDDVEDSESDVESMSESDEEMPRFENELERELYTSRKHEETKRKQERDRVKQRMKEKTYLDRSRSPPSRTRKIRQINVDQDIAMNELKSERERKSEGQRDVLMDDDDAYSDEEEQEKVQEEEEWELNLEQLQSIQLTRNLLLRYYQKEFFDETCKDFFVRIGALREGQHVHRVSRIVGVVNLKQKYPFGKGQTTKHLALEYGITRNFAMRYISNDPFSQDEFERWKRTTEKAVQANKGEKGNEKRIPDLGWIETKRKHLKEMANFKLTEKQTKEKIEENNKKGIYANPTARKMELSALLQEETDPDKIIELEREMADVIAYLDKTQTRLLATKESNLVTEIKKRRTKQYNEKLARMSKQKAIQKEKELLENEIDVDIRSSVDSFNPTTVTIESEHMFDIGIEVFERKSSKRDAVFKPVVLKREEIPVTDADPRKLISLDLYYENFA